MSSNNGSNLRLLSVFFCVGVQVFMSIASVLGVEIGSKLFNIEKEGGFNKNGGSKEMDVKK